MVYRKVILCLSVLFALQCGGGKPIPTNIDALLKGKTPRGSKVQFKGVIIPDSAIRVGGLFSGTKVYAVVVPVGGTYFQELKGIKKELQKFKKNDLRILRRSLRNERKFRKILTKYDALTKKIRESQVNPRNLPAIQLKEASKITKDFDWNMVSKVRSRKTDDLFGLNLKTPTTTAIIYEVETAEERISVLEAQWPPNLKDSMPDLSGIHVNRFNSGAVYRFNRMVNKYNKELKRRRQLLIVLITEQVKGMEYIIDERLRLSESFTNITARLSEKDDKATSTFKHFYHGSPELYLEEIASPGKSFVEQYFRKTAYLITSYPSGANLYVNGKKMGKTPFLTSPMKIGEKFTYSVKLNKSETEGRPQVVTASSTGFKKLQLVLK